MTTAARVRSVACPSCAAPLPLREDQRTFRCAACGSRCVLDGVEAAPRSLALPRVTREEAVARVRRSLGEWPVREGAAERAAILACELFWVPFSEFEAVTAGTVVRNEGTKVVRSGRVDWSTGRRRFLDDAGNEIAEHEHYRRRAVQVRDTHVVLREHRACRRAGGPRDWGLDAIDADAVFDDPGTVLVARGSPDAPPGHVLEPESGREAAEAEVQRSAAANGLPDLGFVVAEIRYVHVPVWVVRFRIDGHPYTFVLDGLRDRVLAGRAPEAPRRGALFLVLAAAYLGLPLGKIVAAAAAGSRDGFEALWMWVLGVVAHLGIVSFVLPALLLAPLAWAWGEFRFRGEVAFGPDGARVVKSSRPARTFLERVIDRLLAMAQRAQEDAVDGTGSWGRRW